MRHGSSKKIPELKNVKIQIKKITPISRMHPIKIQFAGLNIADDPELREKLELPPMPHHHHDALLDVLKDYERLRPGKLYKIKRSYSLHDGGDATGTTVVYYKAMNPHNVVNRLIPGNVYLYVGVTDERSQSHGVSGVATTHWQEFYHSFITPDGDCKGSWETQDVLVCGGLSLYFDEATDGQQQHHV